MSNPFEEFVPTGKDNPFMVYTAAPVADETEQDIIRRTNSPSEETPYTFGLSEVTGFAKGLANSILSTPQIVGGTLTEAGELSAGMEGQSPAEVARNSLARRMAAYHARGEIPSIFGTAGIVLGAEKDALLSLLSDGEAPKAMVRAGNAITEHNREALIRMGLTPENGGMPYDIGNTLGQVVISVGSSVVTKSPALGAAYMASLINSQDYAEARKAGKEPEEAAAIAASSAYGQAMIEMIGGRVFLAAAASSSFLKKVLIRAAGQSAEEGAQGVVEETVKGVTGVRDTPLGEKVANIGYQALLGFIVGVPVSAVVGKIEAMGREAGLTDEQIKAVAENLTANKDELIGAAAGLMEREISGATDDAPAREATLKAARGVLEAGGRSPEYYVINDPIGGDSPLGVQVIYRADSVTLFPDAGAPIEIKPMIDAGFTLEQAIGQSLSESGKDGGAVIKRPTESRANGTPAATPANAEPPPAGTRAEDSAAREILLSPAQSEEVKQAVRGLPEGFTAKQLQEAVDSAPDTRLAESLALEERQATALRESRDRWREMTSSIRENAAMTKKQVKEAQSMLAEFINESGLSIEDKGKFLATLKNTQTAAQLVNNIDGIEARINSLLDAAQRRQAVADIRKKVAKARSSNVIAVDFAKQIESLFDEIDTKKRRPETLDALRKTLDFMRRNPDARMPKDVLRKLETLDKKPLDEITTEELGAISEAMDNLIAQGKTKLRLMEAKKERLKEKRLAELAAGSVPLSGTDVKRAPIGERLAAVDRIKNRYAEFKNRSKRIAVSINPMDVFFDMLDGGMDYKGVNHRIFKQTIDKAFARYLNLKESATREVKALADALKLTEQNFERIGAWAVLQQDGGKKKLLDTGFTEAEIAAVKLTASEARMYRLMREKLDGMLPAIQETMRIVYNKDVEGVREYFPFMTDHEAMADFEIQDQIGDNVPTIGAKKNVERGFTEKRTGGRQKIRIDALGVFLRHIDNAAYLVEMGGDIKALGDVATAQEYGQAVGDIGQEMVVEWIDVLARKGNRPGRIHAIDTLRRNVGLAMLGFKLSTVLIQPTALADGAALVGGRYVFGGVYKVATSREWRRFLWDHLPEVRERAGDDPSYLEMGGDGLVGDVRRAGFWALKHIDALVASSVAAGAYTRSVESRGGVVDLANPDPEAVAEAQLMMRRTQASAFAKDSPAIVTQGGVTGNISIDRLLLQFQTFMLNRWSLIKHDMWALGVKEGNTGKALNIATWLILANAAEIGIRRLGKEIISALTGDEMDEWEDTVGKEALTTALSNVPFVSQAVSSFEYGEVPVPAVGAVTQFTQRLQWAAASEDDEDKAKHLTEAAILGAGVAFGVPGTIQAEQILRKSLKEE